MDIAAFRAAIDAVVATLPEQYRSALADVVILVKDTPDDRADADLLGLYEGEPLTDWDREYSGKLPDTITLFWRNIEDEARTETEILRVIRETLLHEIAHHFGFEHDRIDVWEERWARGRE